MQLEQTFTLVAAPETVWAAFHDVRLLVECLPGASLKDTSTTPVQGEDIPLTFKVKLGPIAAGFSGTGRIALDEATRAGTFSGSAVDTKTNSRVKGEARFALLADGLGTRVTMNVDHTVTGSLAQFSREGIVRALAETLTRQFADNLQARLPQAPVAEPVAPSTAVPAADGAPAATPAHAGPAPGPLPASAARTAPAADTSSIDLWTLLKAWLRGLFSARRG